MCITLVLTVSQLWVNLSSMESAVFQVQIKRISSCRKGSFLVTILLDEGVDLMKSILWRSSYVKITGTATLLILLICLSYANLGQAAVVGLWQFNESSGTTADDSSGNGNDGEFVGPNWSRISGQSGFGTAGEFLNNWADGSYVEVPGHYSLVVGENAGDPWTYAAWGLEYDDGDPYLPSFQAEYGTIIHTRRTLSDDFPYPTPDYGITLQSGAIGDDQYYIWHGTNTNWQIGSNDPNGTTAPTPSSRFDVWTHYAYTYDGSDLRFYINGSEQYAVNIGAESATYSGHTGALQIGGVPGFGNFDSDPNNDNTRNWHGALDDVAVFNEALSPTDISTIMGGNFSSFIDPLPPPAVMEWQTTTFGDWDTPTNWDPVEVPNHTGTSVVFGNQTLAPTTVVNDQSITVKGVEFNHTQEYAIAGSGSLTIDTGGAGTASISVVNAGASVSHEFQIPVQLASNTNLSVDAGTVLEFDQPLELGSNTMNITGSGVVMVNNSGGTGTTGTLTNLATLGGSGKITGDLQNLSTSTLMVDISGTDPLFCQGLSVAGNAFLDGTLDITLSGGFSPTNGDMFTVLTAGSINDLGLILAGDSENFSYSIVSGTDLVLTYSSGQAGDFDNDGDVDGADFILWQQNTSIGDLQDWIDNFGWTASAPTASAVPEPSTFLLGMLGMAACASLRRRRSAQVEQAPVATSAPATDGTARSSRRVFTGIMAVAILCLCSSALHATELIFDGEYGGNAVVPGTYTPWADGYQLVDEYGDRVATTVQNDVASDDWGGTDWYNLFYGIGAEGATPNISVEWPSFTWPSYYYWGSYAGFTDAIYPSSGDPGPGMWGISFVPDAGVQARVNSLDISRIGTAANLTISVFEGNDPNNPGPQLYSSGSISVNSNTPQTLSPNVSGTAGTPISIVFSFEDTVEPLWNWAIDNVVFSQIGGGLPTSAEWQLDGTGRWTDAGNWSPDYTPNLIANGNDRTAVFGNVTTGPTTVVIDDDVTVKTLQIDHDQAYTLAGTGTLTLDADTGTASIDVLNPGSSVTHQITAELSLNDDTVVSMASGTTLELNNKLSLNGNNLTMSGSGTLSVNNAVESGGGTVSLVAAAMTGSGIIAGDVVNGGTVAPGNSPGVLTVLGDYDQSADGALVIELAGTQAGVEYDVLGVGGTASLDGLLEVVLIDGFIPAEGDTFQILDFGSTAGDFAELSLPVGFAWDTSNLASQGTLSMIGAIPEPSSCALGLLALAGLLARRRPIC